MWMTVVALRRSLADRVAIQAARMLEDTTSLDEQRARAFGLIRDRRECLGPAQIFGARGQCSRARQNDDDQSYFLR
jgi:hypothetical protein